MSQGPLDRLEKAYSPKESMPLGGYAALTLVFNSLLLAALRTKQREKLEPGDVILTGIAAHKLSRIITKDAVTSFIRAPFTRYQEPLGYGELQERPRTEKGAMLLAAELLTCNYCMSAWAGLGLFWGFSRFPRAARQLAGFFSSVAISDFLHVIYEERRTRANVLTLREESLDEKLGKGHAA